MTDSIGRTSGPSPDARVDGLLARLTLPEKIGLLHQWQAPVERLGLRPLRTGTEALHGVAWLGTATVFPQVIGLASSWNAELVRAVGAAVGDEVRAKHHADPGRVGLNVWAPVVNPLRDPRWGRNEEGWSEDPGLTGRLATAYATGLRGGHPDRLRTAPTLKHFLGYNNETDRATTSSDLPPRVLHEYELPAFRAPLAAGAAVAVMASYNLVNGVPAHLSPLIAAELRRMAPDEIMVVGDAGAATNIAGAQAHLPDHVSGFAAALRAGIDSFTEDDTDTRPTVERLTEALARGLITAADVDRAARRVLSVRSRLGDLDPPESDPWAGCPRTWWTARRTGNSPARPPGSRWCCCATTGCSPGPDARSAPRRARSAGRRGAHGLVQRHPAVRRHAARGPDRAGGRGDHPQRGGPIARAGGRYVRATADDDGGPLAADAPSATEDTWFDVFDWGAEAVALRAVANGRHVGADDDGDLVNDRPGPGGWVVRETFRFAPGPDGTVLLRHLATDRYVAVGPDGRLRVDAADPDAATPFAVELLVDGAARAAELAAAADVAVVALGNHPMVNGRETEDRVDLALPAGQEALLRAVHAANPRTVLALTSSYPYAIGWADAHLPAVLWSAHGGQEHGAGLASVLLGDAEPGGRLTQTWYADAADLPNLLDYDIIGSDATYLYHRGEPLYPFGHGLSYTRFDYADLRFSATSVTADGEVEVSVEVTNSGTRVGEEIVQLYTRQRRSRVKQPLRQLRDHARITLAPGERRVVRLRLRATELGWWDDSLGGHVVEDAPHSVLVGRSVGDIRLVGTISVRGTAGGPVRAADGAGAAREASGAGRVR